MASDITSILVAVSKIVPSIMMLLKTFGGIVGIYFVGNSLYTYYAVSNPANARALSSNQQPTVLGATFQLVIGALLVSFSQELALQSIVSSILGFDTFVMPSSLSYTGTLSSLSVTDIQKSIGLAIENILALVGSVAIVKGLLVCRRISLGFSREPFGHVVGYVIAGAACLNIKQFALMLDNSLGFNFSSLFFGG